MGFGCNHLVRAEVDDPARLGVKLLPRQLVLHPKRAAAIDRRTKHSLFGGRFLRPSGNPYLTAPCHSAPHHTPHSVHSTRRSHAHAGTSAPDTVSLCNAQCGHGAYQRNPVRRRRQVRRGTPKARPMSRCDEGAGGWHGACIADAEPTGARAAARRATGSSMPANCESSPTTDRSASVVVTCRTQCETAWPRPVKARPLFGRAVRPSARGSTPGASWRSERAPRGSGLGLAWLGKARLG
jgi:hypothetical protein